MNMTTAMPLSIEFFPPKTPEGVEKLRLVRQQLYALQPEFCSVTFGAGGSTQEGTFNTVRDILGGVRSTCTYVGASQLKELTKRTTFIRVREQENNVYGKE